MIGYEASFGAILLAYCFFAVGELLLKRRARDVLSANQCFLTGLSAGAILLFPLSVLFPRNALNIVLILLIAAGCFVFQRTVREWTVPRVSFPRPYPDPMESLLFLVVALAFVQFTVQNFRLSFLWDGYQIWATKAMVLYHEGGLSKTLISRDDLSLERIRDYPPMVPLYEALQTKLRGVFEWNALKPVFELFYLSLLISTYDAARSLVSRRTAMGATALLALIPEVSTRYAIGAYADMPQAALVAGAAAALLRNEPGKIGIRSAIPWLIGGVLYVKSEGLILAAIIVGSAAAYQLLRSPKQAIERVRLQWIAFLAVVAFFVLRHEMTVWLGGFDGTYGPLDHAHFQRALSNIALIPKLCLQYAIDRTEWGVLWPAFGFAAVIVLVAGDKRERFLTFAALTVLAAYTSIFYFTNWPIALHIDQAYDRLLTQISPAAVLVIAIAFERLWNPKPQELETAAQAG